jgi:excisionase family DNA binding protein
LAKQELISLAEAAVLFGLSSSHLRRLAERGDIEAAKIGRNWVTTRQAIKQYVGDNEKRRNDPYKRKR